MNAPAAPSDPVPAGGAGSPALMNTYARSELAFERGEGAWLIAVDGRRFLDFASGIAVTALGPLPSAPGRGADRAGRPSSGTPPTSIACRGRRSWRSGWSPRPSPTGGQVFFGNSGVEAIECGLKLVRKYHDDFGDPARYRVITCEGSFHGRTLAGLAAAGNEKYLKGYAPYVDGFDHVPFGNLNELRAKIGPETAAILVEPVQGEGGMRAASVEYLQGPARGVRRVRPAAVLRRGAVRHGPHRQAVRPRMGRRDARHRGDRQGHRRRLPLGACLATGKVAAAFGHGSHGTTFGGNPLAMAVGNAVLDVMLAPGFLRRRGEAGRAPGEAASRSWSTSTRTCSRMCAARA